jgi:[NiFe] hydrogenase assembly HybE family chaperone
MNPPANLLPNPSEALVRTFETIENTRMRGLPFLNPALHVEAVGFREWGAHWLGVLLTPWTMNLIVMPRDTAQWFALAKGEKKTFAFPYGNFEFIAAHEPLLGDGVHGEYLMCTLFSPTQQFADHDTARMTADEVMKQLFDNEAAPADEDAPPPPPDAEKPNLETRLKTPMSKRDFLRGGFLKREGS